VTLLHSPNIPDWYKEGTDTEKRFPVVYIALVCLDIFGWLQLEIFVCTLLCKKTVILSIWKKGCLMGKVKKFDLREILSYSLPQNLYYVRKYSQSNQNSLSFIYFALTRKFFICSFIIGMFSASFWNMEEIDTIL